MPTDARMLEEPSEREVRNMAARPIPAPLRIIDEQDADHLLLVWLGGDLP